MQPGEGKIGLGLHAPGPQHGRHGPRYLGGVLKQCRLTDPRLAQQHQTAALAVAGVADQPLDPAAVALTADQSCIWLRHIQPITQQRKISDTIAWAPGRFRWGPPPPSVSVAATC